MEVGRITIAGSRLDLRMGHLWHVLDPSAPFETTRSTGGGKQDRAVRKLLSERLTGALYEYAFAAVDAAAAARTQRNDMVHQDWVTRPDLSGDPIRPELRVTYEGRWDPDSPLVEVWMRVPSRGINVEAAPSLEELSAVAQALAEAADRIFGVTLSVASSRVTGTPPGYVHPPEAADSPA
ncbi:hypothetical protein SAMN05660657_03398 [Geodermatophilus amargosae]|uniref:Uncharacterized protein n=1 Tax=Geodermatophilus amargosae TaxID=1296565 RepID=A0A1I7B7Y5_9ACTN|nr:hypothetical protein [Geodermatophilus amargosae]SFT83265.1 hypothetical protein SAMN05660657_03398 [Geodermatophilus amargosae]